MQIILRTAIFCVLSGLFLQCSISNPKKSIEDLKTAFNDESTASLKYSKFAQVAQKEGHETISKLFDAVSESSNILANTHRKALETLGSRPGFAEIGSFDVKTTIENLQSAINGEAYEVQTMYPKFIRDAENEKAPQAGKSFTWAWDTGKKHMNYFRRAAISLSKGTTSGFPLTWFLCPVCGNTYNSVDVKPICDFCLSKQESFNGYVQASE